MQPYSFSTIDGEPDFHELYSKVICEVATKWLTIGLELQLSTRELNEIDADNTRVAQKCYEVFQQWRRRETRPFTWGTVIHVLKSPAVGEPALAERLREYLCTTTIYP